MTVRLDKWLWAARFFKTRGLARSAIDGGHVDYNGTRAKPSKNVEIGAQLTITKGQTRLVVDVLALSDQRRGAPEAQLLYAETEASKTQREENALRRKAMAAGIMAPSTRPNKKDRRELTRLQRQENS
ncbi:MAG: S4 domain-containing protein [Pseudomonadales bacterium]|jgi:ribosome-associated heat shock protein Hsp15